MSGPSYTPDAKAFIPQPYNISLLSQRDVHLQVPLNFVPRPGISLSAACFAHGVYETNAFVQCLANLLSIGYGRLDVDLYWDPQRHVWSFCPAQIPGPAPAATGSAIPATVTATTQRALTGGRASTRALDADVKARQVVETIDVPFTGSSGVVTSSTLQAVTILPERTSTSSVSASPTPTPSADSETPYTLGPYTCSPDIDLRLLIQLMYAYLISTDNTLEAQIKYLIFNIHAASPADDPTAPALAPNASSLPAPQDLVGAQFNANMSSYLYTPMLLASQRSNIAGSWDTVDNSSRPDSSYFSTTDDGASSLDGWPSESFVEFEKGQRVLLGVGNVDPQMSNTSLGLDQGLVFSSDMVSSLRNVTYNAAGSLTDGCFFDATNDSLAAVNNSNAYALSLPASAFTGPALLNVNVTISPLVNLIECGISYLLNSTLINSTADADPTPYINFAISASLWSWAQGEPLGDSAIISTTSDDNSDDNQSASPADFRCAVFDTSNNGRWHTAFCQASYLGACRATSNPLAWTFSQGDTAHYMQLADRCLDNSTFAAPRTPLENAYLLQAARQAGHERVFININSLDVESCWVTGVNTTCPYVEPTNTNAVAVVVPTVAAVIILAVTIFVLLVKCGANRSASRRRRAGVAGWDYEGVPS